MYVIQDSRSAGFGILGREGSRVFIVNVGQAKICPRAQFKVGAGAQCKRCSGAHLFLAIDRVTVYLFLATDNSTLNINIYSGKQ